VPLHEQIVANRPPKTSSSSVSVSSVNWRSMYVTSSRRSTRNRP
jgi:hypothetical protein